jgi:hypothetical protein
MPSPPLVVTNSFQIRLLQTMSGNAAVNVLHGRRPAATAIDQTFANTLGTAIKAAYSANMAPLCGVSTGLAKVGVRDLGSPSQTEYLDSGATALGSAVDDPLPTSLAVCVTLRTAKSGKSFRGRVYIGGFTELQNTSAAVTAATASTAATGFVSAIDAALVAQGCKLVVLSRPAYAYVDNRTWTLPAGATEVEVIGRGNARSGEINDLQIVQARTDGWESQRRRANTRGNGGALFTAISTRDLVTGEHSGSGSQELNDVNASVV